jgi:5-methyltetrahydrofolate--homocysteine methyltransferase
MGRVSLRERIKEGLFLLDGAMGTELMAREVEGGSSNDYLNITSPETILDIHRSYLLAGSDAVITNTFGASRCALERHGLGEESEKINKAAAQIARQAAGEKRYVLGDIGPSGDFLEPLGNLKPDELQGAFVEQAKVLAEGGVDGFIIETMAALDELKIAIEAVKSVGELPVFVSLAYGAAAGEFRTMMGVDPIAVAEEIAGLGIEAVGFNCGTLSMEEYVKLAETYASEIKGKVVILAEPNAGKPELVEDRVVYKVSPEEFAAAAEKIHSAGVNIIGGCCGTSPAHIEAMSKKLRQR